MKLYIFISTKFNTYLVLNMLSYMRTYTISAITRFCRICWRRLGVISWIQINAFQQRETSFISLLSKIFILLDRSCLRFSGRWTKTYDWKNVDEHAELLSLLYSPSSLYFWIIRYSWSSEALTKHSPKQKHASGVKALSFSFSSNSEYFLNSPSH